MSSPQMTRMFGDALSGMAVSLVGGPARRPALRATKLVPVPRAVPATASDGKGSRVDDLHIRHGFVVDGTGAPRRIADVAVRAGSISEVGEVSGRARRTVDADGRLVTPG